MKRKFLFNLLFLTLTSVAQATYISDVTTTPIPRCVDNRLYVVVSVSWDETDEPSTNIAATAYLNANGIALKPMAISEGSSSISMTYITTPTSLGMLVVYARGTDANSQMEEYFFEIVTCE